MAVASHAKALADLADAFDVGGPPARFFLRKPLPSPSTAGRPPIASMRSSTIPRSHLQLGGKILGRGKHLLFGKPLETCLAAADALVAAARQADRRPGVVLRHRFRAGALRLRDRIATGALGPVQGAAMAVPWWRPQTYFTNPVEGRWRATSVAC